LLRLQPLEGDLHAQAVRTASSEHCRQHQRWML
jgi:hypothetical protein